MNYKLQSNHCFGNSTRFNRRPGQSLSTYRKPNHFKSSESWRGFRKNGSDWKSRANDADVQLMSMLPSEEENEENDSMPQSPRSLTRQLAVDINTDKKINELDCSPQEEKSSSELLPDPSLEQDQENLALNADANSSRDEDAAESFEMKNMNREIALTVLEEISEEREHDEYDKLLTEHNSSQNGSSKSSFCDTLALEKKLSRDFSKHLHLTFEEDDLNSPVPYSKGNLDDIPENKNTNDSTGIIEDTPRRFYDNVEDTPMRLNEENDRIGYTDFDTMVNARRSSSFVSSPTPSSLHKSPAQSIPTSPIESTRGSVRSGFSELPFKNSLTDSLRLSGSISPCENRKKNSPGLSTGNPRDRRQDSAGSSRTSEGLLPHEKPSSSRNLFTGVVSGLRTPYSPGGSLKEGHAPREGNRRKGPLRRTMTEFNYPFGSNSSLNEKPQVSPRRRKVSGAIQPPTIFAPLVTNVNNPYKDFVPPVRESAITCDCESADETPGMNCHSCFEKKNADVDSDATEDNSEDHSENFYKNLESLISESQLQCSNNGSSDPYFDENDGYSSRVTEMSERSSVHKELKSDPSQKIDDSSIECSSLEELSDYFEQPFPSYSSLHRKPSLSGAYSTHCIEKEEIPESDELGQMFRPMRTSFSEPHLSLRLPMLPGNNGSPELGPPHEDDVDSLTSENTTTRNLEDIFKDVCSTKEAIEKLETILKSPEPEILTDLADTKQTVQKLDKQVLKLNREVTSLSSDVKTILELLKGFKNGQVTV